jgi:cytochrome c-type biogenesis protein CcmF
MLWETAVVYVAMAVYLAGMVLLVAKRVRPARYLLSAAIIPGLLLLLDYVNAFLSDNFSLEDVYKSSSTGLPQLHKLTASWTTAGGSILLLVVMMGVGLAVHEVWALSKGYEDRVTSLVVSFLIFYFFVAVVMVNPFSQLGSSPSNGLGLTPSLQSDWAAIHPPTVFGAYVVALFAYCSVLSNRLSKGGPRLGDGRLLTGAWVLLGGGIALGGVWAYQTLGWGGYWSWDPIETSALIPWLAISAVLFARRQGNGNLELFGMTLATSTLLLISYVARGSSVESLHAYGDLATGIPFILLALFPVFFSLATFLKSRPGAAFRTAPAKGEFYLLEFWCLVLLAAANLVLLILEVFAGDFGVMFAPSPALHNYVSFLFVLPLATLLAVEGSMERPSVKYAVILGPILLALGALLWFAGIVTESPYLAVGLAFFLALSAGGCIGVVSTLSSQPRRAPTASTVRYLTVLGIGILLIGVLVSASTRTTATVTMGAGESITVGGSTLTVLSITTSPGAGTVDMPGHGIVPATIDTLVTYAISGQTGTSSTLLKFFPVPDEFFSIPSLYSSLTRDVYVVASSTTSIDEVSGQVFQSGGSGSPALVAITVQTIPGIWLVWVGAGLMVLVNLYFVVRRTPYRAAEPGLEEASSSPVENSSG